ncbi:MAG: DUF4349 domain-containing protein [Polyangiaceae bacterium]|nr:DUF4349 domain-containing protein [Polyangiaceae bacterium]
MVPSGCASAGGAQAKYAYRSADTAATGANIQAVGKESRDFESYEIDGAQVSADGGDLWSGGEVDLPLKKEAPAREEASPAPPPPPAPGFAAQAPATPSTRQTEAPAEQAPASTPAHAKDKQADSGTVSVIRAPMLVYTGRVQMAVYEVRNSLGEVETLARALGGFLAKRDDHSITIRVPASRFDEAMRRIEKLGDMISRDVQVEDVTEEFNDVEIRLKNARAVRDRLEQLLSKATKVEESIQIERELERVALTIERLEGRMKFLKDRATFSTITVTFQPRSAAELGKRPFNLPVPWLYGLGLGRLLSL